jgi:SAM-dependent methyltransferase
MPSPTPPDGPSSWDAASRGYADIALRMMEPFADALLGCLEVTPSMRALEVAAGTGALTVNLAPKVQSVLATDFSPKMIEALRARLSAMGQANVTCEVMDGQALSVADASFDRVACSFALMLFPDRAKGFSELRRALRPGGRAAVSAWAGPDEFEAFALFLHALKAAFPDMPPPPGPPPVFSLANPVTFAAEMEAAGFKDVSVDKVSRELEVESFEDVWAMLTVGAPPVQALFDRTGPGGKEKIRNALAQIVDQRFGNRSFILTNKATIGSGVAP